MKNWKVGKKFLMTFGVVVVLFLVSVVFASVCIMYAKGSYQDFYSGAYENVERMGEVRTAAQEEGRALAMAVAASEDSVIAGFLDEADQCAADMESTLNQMISSMTGDASALQEILGTLSEDARLREQIGEYASQNTEQGDRMANELLTGEYSQALNACITSVQEAYDRITADNTSRYESAMMMENGLFTVAVIIAAAALIITLLVAMRLIKDVLTPLRAIGQAMEEVRQGNLSIRIPYESQDEFGQMAAQVEEVIGNVSTIIQDIESVVGSMAEGDFTASTTNGHLYIGDYQKIYHSIHKLKVEFNETLHTLSQSADQVASGSEQVSAGAQALSQGATEQASSVEELAASINEISTHINQNAESMQDMGGKAQHIAEEAQESNQRMQDMVNAMSDISNSSSEIGKIIKTIEDIAFQTNILALNAAVEAARAGAAGKGFAVVADEVRNLASKSAEASKNTASLIENSLRAVERGKEIADKTAKSLSTVMENINEANHMMTTLAQTSHEQAEFVTQITQGIDQISSVVQTNSATAQESAAASEELSSQANMLKELAGRFKLDGGGGQAPAAAAPAHESSAAVPSQRGYAGSDKY